MNRKPVIAAVALLLVVATVFWFYRRAEARDGAAYRTDTIERGDIFATVAATGSLSAVTTVQVGTQVSGQVSAIYVDFNDRVKQGQLIARIDPTLQEQAVAEAQAGLERSRAELRQAEQNYDRNKQLYDRKVITDTEFTSIEYQRSVARANLRSAEIALDRAQRNLGYTAIYAPIDGIVVERNVDVGQTVAASLNTPQLFLIAQDLGEMQILANVDESDIGMIHEGQQVRFTVQTYPDERFTGVVQQVRLQSTSTENVVNYTVAVKVENPDGRLLPGMTATVDFVTASAEDVLKVPNAALRFRPTGMPAASGQGMQGAPGAPGARGGNGGAAAGGGPAGGRPAGGEAGGAPSRGGRQATLWRVDGTTGELVAIPVQAGITDGMMTEVRGDGLQEGTQVVVGMTTGAAPAGVSSPFQQQQGQRRGPPGGF